MNGRPSYRLGSRELTRLVLARASARRAVSPAEERFAEETLIAFRREIGVTVRFASPVISPLIGRVGLELDDVAWEFRPVPGWPSRPGLPIRSTNGLNAANGIGAGSPWAPFGRSAKTIFNECHGVDIMPPGDAR
jgi:hypothetical protein